MNPMASIWYYLNLILLNIREYFLIRFKWVDFRFLTNNLKCWTVESQCLIKVWNVSELSQKCFYIDQPLDFCFMVLVHISFQKGYKLYFAFEEVLSSADSLILGDLLIRQLIHKFYLNRVILRKHTTEQVNSPKDLSLDSLMGAASTLIQASTLSGYLQATVIAVLPPKL